MAEPYFFAAQGLQGLVLAAAHGFSAAQGLAFAAAQGLAAAAQGLLVAAHGLALAAQGLHGLLAPQAADAWVLVTTAVPVRPPTTRPTPITTGMTVVDSNLLLNGFMEVLPEFDCTLGQRMPSEAPQLAVFEESGESPWVTSALRRDAPISQVMRRRIWSKALSRSAFSVVMSRSRRPVAWMAGIKCSSTSLPCG